MLICSECYTKTTRPRSSLGEQRRFVLTFLRRRTRDANWLLQKGVESLPRPVPRIPKSALASAEKPGLSESVVVLDVILVRVVEMGAVIRAPVQRNGRLRGAPCPTSPTHHSSCPPRLRADSPTSSVTPLATPQPLTWRPRWTCGEGLPSRKRTCTPGALDVVQQVSRQVTVDDDLIVDELLPLTNS